VEEGSDQPPSDAYLYALRDEAAYLQADEDEKPEIIAEPPPDPPGSSAGSAGGPTGGCCSARSIRCGIPRPSPSSR
jgi:hypothetical protein